MRGTERAAPRCPADLSLRTEEAMSRLTSALAAWRRAAPWIAGVAVAAVAGGAFMLVTGAIETRAAAGHTGLETAVLHSTLKTSVAAGAEGIEPPEDLGSADRVALGASTYAQYCVSCHGAPDMGQSPIALAMTPRPRYAVETAPQWTDAELFYLLKNGVKYAGMPAWPVVERDDEIWSVVSFVRQLPEMTYAEYRRLAYGAAGGPPPKAAPVFVGAQAPEGRETASLQERGSSDYYRYETPAAMFGGLQANTLRNCASCHGYQGVAISSGLVPNLAIQSEEYLAKSLRAYADGSRHSGIMRPIAASLTDAQIDGLAKWYSERADVRSEKPEAGEELVSMGRRIAMNGVDGEAAACESCHGVAKALEGEYPALRGQSAAYHVAQLKQFSMENRGDVVSVNPMYAISHALTGEQMEAVAGWYALQDPGDYDLEEAYGDAGGDGDAEMEN